MKDKTKKVALSGASGNIGRALRSELPHLGYALRSCGGRTPLSPRYAGEDVMNGDLRQPEVVDALLRGMDVLVHMAGTSVERPLLEIVQNNLVALHEVYEGARRQGVRRVVFASSNHAFGMHAVDSKLEQGASYRPDGFYGLSKMWGEGLARLYWDKHGIESVCLRIGSAEKVPANRRHLSTWLGPEDLIRMIECSIDAPDVGYAEVWGISNNQRAYWDVSQANAIGYRPRQNAEEWASSVENVPAHPDALAARFQGGAFAVDGFTRDGRRESDSDS
jgi:uronate dehydrogenase